MSPRKASATLPLADSPGKRQARKRELPNGDDESGSPNKPPQLPKRHRAAHDPTPDGDDSTDEPPPPAENGIVVNPHGGNPAEEEASPQIEAMTPSRRKPGRPRGSLNKKTATPSRSRAGVKWATPTTTRLMGMDTPSRRNLADRSARRKVARTLIDRVVGDGVSDDDEDGAADEILAREIYSSDDDNDEPNGAGGDKNTTAAAPAPASAEEALVAETPSKRRPGRPRGSGRGGARGGARGGRKRSPTPPRDLPAHELYLFQNKPGAAGKASSSNRLLSSTLELLTHDEYFTLLRSYEDPHADGVRLLRSIHAQSFRQWEFELEQGFTVCLYGYGSKRDLLRDFATELYRHARQKEEDDDGDGDGDGDEKQERAGSRIVVVNGHVRGGLKEALATMARAVDPTHKLPATTAVAMAQGLQALLAANPSVVLTVVLNSIDAPALRKGGTAGANTTSTVNTATGTGGVVAGTAQSVLAQLAAHRQVRLACSADTPGFALLWDAGARALLNLALHDCTTFASPGPAELDVVDEVHELLGRRARRVGGKDGVVFVLRSLPENAKNLFRLLVTEALVAMEEGDGGGFGGDADGDGEVDASGAAEGPVVEYRIMYNKAAEEFICSSEMAFRTLLKEFHDHQIITSRKDPLGTELLCLPFRKDELESILEDLMS
ncbi:hypothetical protein RB597_000797 [Gaeumannomyces tritici]